MNTEIKLKRKLKVDRAVYSQNLPIPIANAPKKDFIVELALMHKYGIITVLPFSEYVSLSFAQRKPDGKLRLLGILRKIHTLIPDDYTNKIHPVSTLSDKAQHLAAKYLFCKLLCSQAYSACRWWTNDQRKCSPSNLPAEPLPTNDLHKVSADLCLLFQASWASTSTICQGWPMCPKRGWYWNCRQYCHGSYPEHSGSFPVHSPSSIETDNWKLAFWRHTSWIPRQNQFIRWGITTNSQNSELLKQIEVPQIEKGFTALSGVRKVLQKLSSQDGWQVQPLLQTLKSRSPYEKHIRIERKLWYIKQRTKWCLPTRIETTEFWEAASLNDGCKLQKPQLHPHDWRYYGPKDPTKERNFTTVAFG